MKKTTYYIFIVLFVFISSAPFWGMIFYKNKSNHEKRELENLGNISGVSSLNQFITDNHAFRDFLSEIYLTLSVKILDESPIPGTAVLGKAGWLFIGDNYEKTNSASIGVIPIKKSKADESCYKFNKMKLFCDSLGVDLYFVIAPEKQNIYPEYLRVKPNSIPRVKTYIKKQLQEKYNITTIDLADFFQSKNIDSLFYYKTDSHWNDYGAHVATTRLIEIISNKYPLTIPYLDNFSITKDVNKTDERDLAYILQTLYEDEYFKITPKTTQDIEKTELFNSSAFHLKNNSNPNKVKAVLIGDSFSPAMINPLIYSVHELIACRHYLYNKEILIREMEKTGKPQFIIFEIVERNLYDLYDINILSELYK